MIIPFVGNEAKVIEALRRGEVIAVPTDTVYGLCCSVFCDSAIERIYNIKHRPTSQPVAIVVAKISDIYKYVDSTKLPVNASFIFEQFLPGPLTVLLESNGVIKSEHVVHKCRIAFRVVDVYPLTEIIKSVGCPLVLTSANVHGANNCFTAKQVFSQLGEEVRYIIKARDGEKCFYKESTIIHFEDGKVVIDREGVVSKDDFISHDIDVIS